MSRRGWLLFLALGTVWGIPYLLIRVAVHDLDPVVVAFGRCAIGALVLLPLALRRGLLREVLPHWRWVAVFTLVEITGPWLLLGHAETVLTSSLAGLLVAATPMVAAVLLSRMGVEPLDRRRVAGLVVGLAGLVVVLGLDLERSDLGAVGAVFLVSLGYATGPAVIARRLDGVPALGVVTVSLVLASALYAPFVPAALPPRSVPVEAVASVVALGVLCTAAAFVVFFALVAETGPARSTVITYLNPVVALALGVLVLGEPVTAGLPIGLVLVVGGSVLATARATRAPAAVPPAPVLTAEAAA